MTDMHLQIHAYDCLDRVACSVFLYDLDQPAGDDRLALGLVTTVRGCGEDDPKVWVSDALLAILEAL